jgi:hypothetical protein
MLLAGAGEIFLFITTLKTFLWLPFSVYWGVLQQGVKEGVE